jgi:hypothetical protein
VPARCAARQGPQDPDRFDTIQRWLREHRVTALGLRYRLRPADGVVFAPGFLPVPYLWEGRDEFARAVQWPTRVLRGSVKVVDENGLPLPVAARLRRTVHDLTG